MEGRGVTAHPSSSPKAERAGAQSPAGDAPRAGGMLPVVIPPPTGEAQADPDGRSALEGEHDPQDEPQPGASAPEGGPGPAGEQPAGAGNDQNVGEPPAGAVPASAVPSDTMPSDRMPRARVDARLLEAALLNLRKRVAAIPLVFDIPGADDVSAERAKLLSQIDDYLLPRVRQSAAPILVALVGSTGAGKSTLVNSIVGTQVSQTGVRRPTTNSPVLACHPDDMHWFAENMFLPTLPRVRQEGLARPGRDGLLVLAACESMTKGFALLDTPDIDSVAASHREFAYQFLDAADLWLFMTSSSRYADAPVWEILQHARERGAALGVVLSRVPRTHRTELVSHFHAMLDANGITASNRFVIPETGVVDNMLPQEVFQPVKDWLTETAQKADRRVAVLSQTMAGVLDTFKLRVPRLAAHVDAQVTLRLRLRRIADGEYTDALASFDQRTRQASLLRGEVLARWQDYADSGDLGAALRSRGRVRKGKRARKGIGNARPSALDAALRSALESLVVSVADQAAERVFAAWRADIAGATLLAAVEADRVRDEKAEREFAFAFGSESAAWAASVAAGSGEAGSRAADERAASLDRSSLDLPARAARAVGAWQDHLMRLLQSENQANQAGGRSGHDIEPLAMLALIGVLGEGAPAPSSVGAAPGPGEPGTERGVAAAGDEIVTIPLEMLAQSFGAAKVSNLLARARADLRDRVQLLLDEELLRFVEILEEAGPVDPVAAVRLYQAEYSLEAAR
jgi:energy-coupling factor transporter ATP-binding protein EcfA2